MSHSIAIVGTRGAGKTVFVTVLANHLSTPKDGVLLIPDSYEIAEYVDLNYAKLQRGEWLDSTNVERKLSWKFRAPGKEEQRFTLLDCPGEDIQRLFAKREFEVESSESNRDKELVEYLLGASTVLLLINLQDFIDDSYEEEKVRNRKLREHSLKEFLTAIKENELQSRLGQSLRPSTYDFRLLGDLALDKDRDADRPSRHIAVVFTAYNQFREHIERRYGNVARFLSKKLPALYYEHFHGKGFVPGILVSAVADTIQGKCPQPGFKHQGLDTVIEWLIDPVQFEKVRSQLSQGQQQQEQKDANGPRMYDW